MPRRPTQLELPRTAGPPARPTRGGRRPGAGRKPRDAKARPNVPHVPRPEHEGRHPVHVTLRAGRGVPSLRSELVRNVLKRALHRQARRAYGRQFQVVHFSLQEDHVHLIVEAADPATFVAGVTPKRGALSGGISGLVISLARQLNLRLGRKGKVWSDRHHRRGLTSPTDVRNTLRYVLQNYKRHGILAFGQGAVDPCSSGLRFDGWADPHAEVVEASPWPEARPRTWLLGRGWLRAGGKLLTSDSPPTAKDVRYSEAQLAYWPRGVPLEGSSLDER